MSKRRNMSSDDIVKWANNQAAKNGDEAEKPPTHKMLSAWQLRRLGYTIAQTAQILNIGTTAVVEWDKKVDKYFEQIPEHRCAVDAMQTMIPRAIARFDKALDSDDEALAVRVAKDILISYKVLVDRHEHTVKDDANTATSKLIDEAERIIALARPKGTTGSDPE